MCFSFLSEKQTTALSACNELCSTDTASRHLNHIYIIYLSKEASNLVVFLPFGSGNLWEKYRSEIQACNMLNFQERNSSVNVFVLHLRTHFVISHSAKGCSFFLHYFNQNSTIQLAKENYTFLSLGTYFKNVLINHGKYHVINVFLTEMNIFVLYLVISQNV